MVPAVLLQSPRQPLRETVTAIGRKRPIALPDLGQARSSHSATHDFDSFNRPARQPPHRVAVRDVVGGGQAVGVVACQLQGLG